MFNLKFCLISFLLHVQIPRLPVFMLTKYLNLNIQHAVKFNRVEVPGNQNILQLLWMAILLTFLLIMFIHIDQRLHIYISRDGGGHGIFPPGKVQLCYWTFYWILNRMGRSIKNSWSCINKICILLAKIKFLTLLMYYKILL